jgi:uncharacterized protein (UPF0332 family)
MIFEPKEFISISKELSVGTTEGHYRSLVNRAYYGAFGYAKIKLNILTTEFSVHKEVITTLKRSPKAEEVKAGSRLESLFNLRKKADYNYNNELKKCNCEFAIKDAEEIIKLIDSE